MNRKPLSRIRVFLTISMLFASFLLPLEARTTGQSNDFAFTQLAKGLPQLFEMAEIARRHGVTLGIYGGTVRDLYLKHKFTIISDLDLIYDSSQPGFPACRDELFELGRREKGRMPFPDFHLDLASSETENERLQLYHREGITATKVGVFLDDRIMDPTCLGVNDLRTHMFRYFPPAREFIPLENLGRYIRDLVRLHTFTLEPGTLALLGSSLARYRDPSTPEGAKVRENVRHCKERLSDGGLLLFPGLIGPLRNDLRFLHNGRKDRLSEFFPLDMFVGDLFRTVTQADDMVSMRREFDIIGVGEFMRDIGLVEEGDILTDQNLSREAVFARFQFPGFQPIIDPERIPLAKRWEETLRKYNYRVLFDMLASEFPAGSKEAEHLRRRRDDFMKNSTYRMLNPGDDFRDMFEGFLDADFNIGILPREKVMKSLDWFMETYLPLGKTTLLPLSADVGMGNGSRIPDLGCLRARYSDEVLKIDRAAHHAFGDLDGYLGIQTGPEMIDLYLHPRTTAGFFALNASETVTLLRKLGYAKIFQVNAAGFSRRVRTIIGYDPRTDRAILAQYDFQTEEQLLNHQARIYLLRRKLPKGAPDRVLVFRRPMALIPNETEFRAFLGSLGEPVKVFFAGFTNPLKACLTDLSFFRIGEMQFMKGYLPSQPGIPRRLAICLSAFGANYGSLPARLLQALASNGLETVVYVGTGGGLSDFKSRFDWSVPDRVFLALPGWAGELEPKRFDNLAARLKLPGMVVNTLHGTVITPLQETVPWIRKACEFGVQSLDCEVWHLVREAALQTRGLRLYVLLNITDFPSDRPLPAKGGINTENSLVQFERVKQALEAIVKDLRTPPAK
ncbi:hypothetical protein AUK22_08945 [bacterium CG2_30_54_10]|nr:MAG: hypothetical protein AUK22_08945 [bacterium CG2_30_54_10]